MIVAPVVSVPAAAARIMWLPMAALIGALLAPSLFWCLNDRSVWAWDQSVYGYWTLNTWAAHRDGLSAWLAAVEGAVRFAPPLVAWLGQFFVPLRHLTGHFESALLLLNFFANGITLWAIDATVRYLGSGLIGRSAAVLVCGGAGVFIALGNTFLVESLMCASVAFSIYVSLRADQMSLLRSSAAIVSTLCTSFLAKASSILFLLPLASYTVVALFLARKTRREDSTPIDYILVGLALLLAAATTTWYRSNWQFVFQHFKDATIGDFALNWGSPVILSKKVSYWLGILSISLSPFMWVSSAIAAILVIAVPIATIRDFRKGGLRHCVEELWRTRSLFALVLVGTLVVTLLMFSLQVNEDPRFIIVTTPIVAVLIGWSLNGVQIPPMIGLSLVITLLFNAALTQLYALGKSPIPIAPFAYLAPVEREVPPDLTYLTQIITPTCINDDPSIKLIAVSYRNLNVNGAMFYSAQLNYGAGKGCKYNSLPFPFIGLAAAIDFVREVEPMFIVTVQPTQQPPPDFANKASKPVAEWVASSKNYERILLLQNGFSLYRRRNNAPVNVGAE